MPPIPPTELILEVAWQCILPAAGAAAFVYAVFVSFGRWAAALGSAAAIVAAYFALNYQALLHGETLSWETTSRLIPWVPDRSSFHFIPRAALVLTITGLATRWLSLLLGLVLPDRLWWIANLLVWLPRWVAVLVVGTWVIPQPWLDEHAWIRPALAAVMLFSWIALDGLCRSGWSSLMMSLIAACFLAAGVVFIYAHSKRFMEVSVSMGFAFAGIAVVSRSARVDASGAVPAAAGFLPALLLNVRYQTESQVPVAAFLLLAFPPLALLPTLLPREGRRNPWIMIPLRTIVVLAPLVIAVMLAMQNEQLPPEEDW